MSVVRRLRIRLGCTCGGWACWLDGLLRCRVQSICDAHDRRIISD